MATTHSAPPSLEDALHSFRSHRGKTLAELSSVGPVLVVFLRHAGCTFCREALSELQRQRERIEASRTSIALVHMVTNDAAGELFAKYGLEDVPRFSDPDRRLYRAFDLHRASLWQLAGPAVWWRGAKVFFGHGSGKIQGDAFQLPGTFILHHGKIVKAHRSADVADRPDFAELAESCPLPGR